MPLLALSAELLLLVAGYLKPKDLRPFLLANKRLYFLLTSVMHKLATRNRYAPVALFFAAVNGNEEMVRLLLEKGKGIKVLNDVTSGEVLFSSPNRCSDETIRFVLEKGANLALEDRNDSAHLRIVLKKYWQKWTEMKSGRVVDSSESEDIEVEDAPPLVQPRFSGPLRRGSRYPRKNPENRTALQWAIVHGYDALLKLLLEKGVNIEYKNEKGQTAVNEATQRSNHVAVRLLIARGANVNTFDHNKATPLHHAANMGASDTIRLLLESGADPTACDKWGAIPLKLAQIKMVDDTLLRETTKVCIHEKEAEFTMFYAAVKKGDVAAAAEILRGGFDVNKKYMRGVGRVEPAIVVASGQGNLEMVKMLLDNGACPNAR